MRTWQARHGQIQKTGFVLIDQAPRLSGDMPMLPIYAQIGANFCRLTFDHLEDFLWLGPNNCGDAALQNARFFKCNLGERVPEELLVIEINRCQDTSRWLVDHIGHIQPSSHASFQQGVIGRMFGKAL